ncbi:hypothetical protein CEXT_90921 [Caerostris extrusa]|uniref:Uncharacterized protein n=1 Tax=Caerostris extrusa TaxID=172846 RepID=A0AAV4N3G1_CAEEX|nr:hypothetical protein CEXT_90921 [Caerostris extrusa]
MNTFKYIILREEGSLNVSTLKRAIVQKCDWAYEDFEIAEMVQDSTMRTLQGRFRKEDDKNTCLRKSIDTLMTVGSNCSPTMATLKYMRLREEGSLKERAFKRATVQKCDWTYEDFFDSRDGVRLYEEHVARTIPQGK